jgi:purine-binding chemotaxis protein CheW
MREEGANGTAAELRQAFDRAFAEPPGAPAEPHEALLAIRAGGAAFAVPLAELTALFVDRRVTRLPSLVPDLLGVAGLRHEVVPVYSIGSLLGGPRSDGVPRWLVVTRGSQAVALAFDRFDGYLRVPRSAILPPTDAAQEHVSASVRHADAVLGVVDVASLLKGIQARNRALVTTKEQ